MMVNVYLSIRMENSDLGSFLCCQNLHKPRRLTIFSNNHMYQADFCKFKVFSNINRHIMTNCTSAQNTLWFSYQMSIDQMNSCLTKGFPESQWSLLSGCYNHSWGRYSSGHCNRNQDKFNSGDSRTYLENWNNYNSTNSSSATNCSIVAPNISYSNSRSSKILFTRYLNSW